MNNICFGCKEPIISGAVATITTPEYTHHEMHLHCAERGRQYIINVRALPAPVVAALPEETQC